MHQRNSYLVAARLEKRSLLVAVNALAGISTFFHGYDQGLMGGVNESFDYAQTMGLGAAGANGDLRITNTLLQGGIVAIYYLGTLIGALSGGAFGDKYGRINTIAFGAVWSLVGAVLQFTAQNSAWMLCARVVNGVGLGMLTTIAPVWGSELAKHTSRGSFIAMEFTLNIFGCVVAYWISYGVSFIDNGHSAFRWRFPIAFQVVPLILLLAICWFFPESPRWLCKVGRDDEARYILKRLRGSNDNIAELELQGIRDLVIAERESPHRTSYFDMFFGIGAGKLHTARRVQLVLWLQILADWTGIAGITMFGPQIFSIAGFTAQKSQLISGLNNISYMLATIVCVFTLDRFGRRKLLWWGAAAQGITMFLAGGLCRAGLNAEGRGEEGAATRFGAAATSMVFLYTFTFGATWLTTPNAYSAEIFPLHVRAKGNAWGIVGWSLGNVSLTLALPYIVARINEKILHVFGACNILSIPLVWAFYPESNQRTLEEMDMLFAAESPWVWDANREFTRLKELHWHEETAEVSDSFDKHELAVRHTEDSRD